MNPNQREECNERKTKEIPDALTAQLLEQNGVCQEAGAFLSAPVSETCKSFMHFLFCPSFVHNMEMQDVSGKKECATGCSQGTGSRTSGKNRPLRTRTGDGRQVRGAGK